MSKNIIVCSDGTGNTTIKGRGTNVFKLYEATSLNGTAPQIAFYDDGVGTEQLKFLKLIGGAFGYGLARNVRRLYADLARSYQPGDKIFLFGFSRGAFTVRTLCGLIATCGIPNSEHYATDDQLVHAVHEAYATYRKKYFRFSGIRKTWTRANRDSVITTKKRRHAVVRKLVAAYRRKHRPHSDVPVEFIGVWDTVAAYGFPVDGIADFWNEFIYPFKFTDHCLHPCVRKARQALAIDEERRTFSPELWDERDEIAGSERIEQVWFAGVHSNIGGGYPKQGMSLITMDWMIGHAIKSGLVIDSSDRNYVSSHSNVNDKLYDSRAGLATIYRYRPRDIAVLCADHGIQPRLHISVAQRMARSTNGYAPGNLSPEFTLVSTGEPMPNSAITQKIALDFMQKHGPPFQQATRWVRQGERAHYIFLVNLVLAAIALLLGNGIRATFTELRASDYLGLLTNAAESHYGIALILFSVVVGYSYWMGRRSGQRAASVYSGYWHEMLVSLQSELGYRLATPGGEGIRPPRGPHFETPRPPTGWHTFFAGAVVVWLLLMVGVLAWALFIRLEGCSQHPQFGSMLDFVCNFRALGTTLLATYLGLVSTLIWHTAKYDPVRNEPESRRSVRSPLAVYRASYRALRVPNTPHRIAHRLGFWTLLITVASFIYLVEVSQFVFLASGSPP
jgi:uncharacterized protein (DUF2235 family)